MTDCFDSSFSKETNYFLDSSREKRRKLDGSSHEANQAALNNSFEHDPILDSLQCSSKENLIFPSHLTTEVPTDPSLSLTNQDSISPLTLSSFFQTSKDHIFAKENLPKTISTVPGYKPLFLDDECETTENKLFHSQKLEFGPVKVADLKPSQAEIQTSSLYPYDPSVSFNFRDSQAFSPESFHIQPAKIAEPSMRSVPLLQKMHPQPRVVYRFTKRPHPDSNSTDLSGPTGPDQVMSPSYPPKKTVIRVAPSKPYPEPSESFSPKPTALSGSFSPTSSPSNSPPLPSFEAQANYIPMITGISHQLTQMEGELSSLREEQSHTDLSQKTCPRVQSIKFRHEKMRGRLLEFSKELQNIHRDQLLDVCLLDRILSMQHHISILQKQLELYTQEVRNFQGRNSGSSKCLAGLVIIEQPFPRVIKKQTRLSSPVVVKLIDAAKSQVQRTGRVTAFLIWEDYQAKKPPITTESNIAEMDEEGVARFGELRFPQGTRLKMVRLQFVMEVKYLNPVDGSWSTATVESETSSPFIIVTNENQWEDAEGILLKRDAFNGQTEIPWSQFVNAQQIHFVRATRQDAQKVSRPLTSKDFSYLNRVRFGGKTHVTQHDFDKFWSWFGKVLHKLRHQRVINSLWSVGYLFGFITKEEASEILQKQEPGTFLVRFSERRPGCFAISFVHQNQWIENNTYPPRTGSPEVRHSLVPTEEISGSRTLADFLLSCPNLRKVVQVDHKMSQLKEQNVELLREFQGRPVFETLTGYEAGLCSGVFGSDLGLGRPRGTSDVEFESD